MKKTILRTIKHVIIGILLVITISCVNENESSLFEGRNIAIRYDLDIVNPLDGCRCVIMSDLMVEFSIEGKKFELAKRDINGDVGNKESMIANGDYEDIKELVIAIKKGQDLTKFVNKVNIIVVISKPCLEQMKEESNGGRNNRTPVDRYKIKN